MSKSAISNSVMNNTIKVSEMKSTWEKTFRKDFPSDLAYQEALSEIMTNRGIDADMYKFSPANLNGEMVIHIYSFVFRL